MKMVSWVVGRGGLLGSALSRALARGNTVLFDPLARFGWSDGDLLQAQIAKAANAFADAAAGAERWEIYWAAGIGTMMSAEAELVPETHALQVLLDAIVRNRSLCTGRGVFALASSAGAIYAGSHEPLINEAIADAPTTAYARAKLEQEAVVGRFAIDSGVAVFIARISTLYGTGQSSAKAQGLLTHISRCIIRDHPIRIFVPLDTIRDYVAADDAAAMMIEAARIEREPAGLRMKIIASERPATIGEVISIFKRIARRAPRIITSTTSASSVYTRRMQFRSIVPPIRQTGPGISLLVGISQVIAAERARFIASSSQCQ